MLGNNLSGFGDLLATPLSVGRAPLDFDAIKHASTGNWVSTIFPAVGIMLRGNGHKHQPCPMCGGTDRFRCDDKRGEGTWICSQCGSGNGFLLVQRYIGADAYETNKVIADAIGFDSSVAISDQQRNDWQSQQIEREAAEEADKALLRVNAALKAQSIWSNAKEVEPTHPYLLRKDIPAPSLRMTASGDLVVPMYQGDNMVNVQTIAPCGKKLFLHGGEVTGSYHIISDKSTLDFGLLLLCEGYATGATLFKAMNGQYPVFVAFNANNLTPVAVSLREQYPLYRIIIGADDDDGTARKMMVKDIADGKNPKPLADYNTGLREARRAADTINGELIMLRNLEDNQ